MTAPQRSYSSPQYDREFEFTKQPRKFQPVEAVPFRWPTRSEDANAYVDGWKELAEKSLADLRLSESGGAKVGHGSGGIMLLRAE